MLGSGSVMFTTSSDQPGTLSILKMVRQALAPAGGSSGREGSGAWEWGAASPQEDHRHVLEAPTLGIMNSVESLNCVICLMA